MCCSTCQYSASSLPPAQAHHGPREVFATIDETSDDFGVVHGPAAVCEPGEYAAGAAGDTYLCEYEYDTAFRVRTSAWLRCRPEAVWAAAQPQMSLLQSGCAQVCTTEAASTVTADVIAAGGLPYS